MNPPKSYGLHLPCRARQVLSDGLITLELAGGQRITASLEGLEWPADHDARVRLQGYAASLIFGAEQLSVWLYSAMRTGDEIHYVHQHERSANRAVWPCRLYLEGRDLATYLVEQRPELRAVAA